MISKIMVSHFDVLKCIMIWFVKIQQICFEKVARIEYFFDGDI